MAVRPAPPSSVQSSPGPPPTTLATSPSRSAPATPPPSPFTSDSASAPKAAAPATTLILKKMPCFWACRLLPVHLTSVFHHKSH
jgi:hypothetical protein